MKKPVVKCLRTTLENGKIIEQAAKKLKLCMSDYLEKAAVQMAQEIK